MNVSVGFVGKESEADLRTVSSVSSSLQTSRELQEESADLYKIQQTGNKKACGPNEGGRRSLKANENVNLKDRL